jgi:hypothetical protein
VARDLSVEVRQAVVTRLRAAPLADGRAYGPAPRTNPVWPFIRLDLPTVTPVPGSCDDGSRYEFNVHAFAKGDDERAASGLAAAIAASLDGFTVRLVDEPEAWLQDLVWTGTQVFRDTDEENGWHGVVRLRAEVSG